MTTKQKILNKALHLFAVNGFNSVSVEQIANAVGIKAPSLYKHYKSKRDILNTILKCMERADSDAAIECNMPNGQIAEREEEYINTSLDDLAEFTKMEFAHWTKEEPSCDFRRMLSVEQYRDAEMAAIYRQYITEGPLLYVRDLFLKYTENTDEAYNEAMRFYAPVFMLYSIYDNGKTSEECEKILDIHIEKFISEKRKGV